MVEYHKPKEKKKKLDLDDYGIRYKDENKRPRFRKISIKF